MVTKSIEYYDNEIERLKASIKRLRAEKRVAVLIEREKKAAEQVKATGENNEKHN